MPLFNQPHCFKQNTNKRLPSFSSTLATIGNICSYEWKTQILHLIFSLSKDFWAETLICHKVWPKGFWGRGIWIRCQMVQIMHSFFLLSIFGPRYWCSSRFDQKSSGRCRFSRNQWKIRSAHLRRLLVKLCEKSVSRLKSPCLVRK